ncbi:MAG: UDP-N-acetylmuramate dehydrogenase [Holdemanella sp.]|nr:UDP-N-acetylmuramate dehydrogenase [Holdemanella sp.]
MNLANKLKIYGEVLEKEPMKKHTTYRIGGEVDYYIYPKNITELGRIIEILKEAKVPYYITGRGSNLLWTDHPFPGAIINMDRSINDYYFEEDGTVIAYAGCSIINLAIEAGKHSFTGLEFASGIPGSVGGGIYMNAGAYKSDLSNVLESVLVLDGEHIHWIRKEDLDFGYRHSIFQKHKDWTILAGKFKLEKGDAQEIRDLMESRHARRVDAQPLDKPCAGSVFRNPESIPAWKLVEQLGYRGKRIGGAQVSKKHCNFIVNENGDATAEDVWTLITSIQKDAKEKYDIDLITEVEKFNW